MMITASEHAQILTRADNRAWAGVENREREECTRHEIGRLTELMEYARHSLGLYQQWITEATQLRERHPGDLQLGQILWDTIEECTTGIKQELQRIADFRQEIEKCRTSTR